MTALALSPSDRDDAATSVPRVHWRWPVVTALLTLLTLLMALISEGDSTYSFTGATGWFDFPDITVPARGASLLLTAIALVLTAVATSLALRHQAIPGAIVVAVGVCFVIAFLSWTVAGSSQSAIPVVRLLSGALIFAVPLIFGALSGVVCERSGIINLAIEAQLLVGAFAGVLVGSIVGTPWVGLLAAPVAGVGVAALLALFTITYRVNHIIVGIVLNVLAIGLTSFLFSTLLTGNGGQLNQALLLPNLPIPLLADVPVIGPVFFDQNILVYLVYVIVVLLQVLLFRSRWGLRTRAVGEHPAAADTVGIKVNALRWRNTLLGGALAGLGGAMFTIGLGLAFSKNMVAGNGYIALAAMILGGWSPRGAVAAAALFGFATNVGFTMQSVGSPVPTEFVLMIPYVVTILAVAGFVKAVRPPAAEGDPYP